MALPIQDWFSSPTRLVTQNQLNSFREALNQLSRLEDSEVTLTLQRKPKNPTIFLFQVVPSLVPPPTLDPNVLLQILQSLELDDIGSSLSVCKAWHQTSTNTLWTKILQRDFVTSNEKNPILIIKQEQQKAWTKKQILATCLEPEYGCSGKNSSDHVIGRCLRGEIDTLKKLNRQSVVRELGEVSLYRGWIYYGNYSGTSDGGCIRFNKAEDMYHVASCDNIIEGGTPLMWAALGGHLPMVRLLCALNPTPNHIHFARPFLKLTAEQIARKNGHLKVARFLTSQEAYEKQEVSWE